MSRRKLGGWGEIQGLQGEEAQAAPRRGVLFRSSGFTGEVKGVGSRHLACVPVNDLSTTAGARGLLSLAAMLGTLHEIKIMGTKKKMDN